LIERVSAGQRRATRGKKVGRDGEVVVVVPVVGGVGIDLY
jgi:hypothetical protein